MGSLNNFFRNLLRYGQSEARRENSFANLSEDQLRAHVRKFLYGTFQLTEAIRPSYNPQFAPTAGYRRNTYHDRKNDVNIPVITVAESREKLMDLFYELLDPLGEMVDIVVEGSHDSSDDGHLDFRREGIDTPVLRSALYDFEDVLLDDGKAGIAVIDQHFPAEVQFDEHKLLIVFGPDLSSFEEILHRHQVKCREAMKFISEADHLHCSDDELRKRFQQLVQAVGADIPWQNDEDPLGGGF